MEVAHALSAPHVVYLYTRITGMEKFLDDETQSMLLLGDHVAGILMRLGMLCSVTSFERIPT